MVGIVKKILRFVAEYFVVVGGLLFIFAMGVLYAFIRPEGLLLNGVFLLIVIGWVIFLIKYFWDLMDKRKNVE